MVEAGDSFVRPLTSLPASALCPLSHCRLRAYCRGDSHYQRSVRVPVRPLVSKRNPGFLMATEWFLSPSWLRHLDRAMLIVENVANAESLRKTDFLSCTLQRELGVTLFCGAFIC